MNIQPINALIAASERMIAEFTTKYGTFAPVPDPGSATDPKEQTTVPDGEVYLDLKAAIVAAELWVEGHYNREDANR